MLRPANGSLPSKNREALLLAPEVPFPVVGGGALRTASLVTYLGERYTLDVIVFRQPSQNDPRSKFPSHLVRRVDVIDLPYQSRNPAARLTRNVARACRGTPPLNDRFRGFAAALASLLEGRSYALGVIEHFWCAPYLAQLRHCCQRTVLDLHNIESELYGTAARVQPWPMAMLFRQFAGGARRLERQWLQHFDDVLVASEADREIVRQALRKPARLTVYPNALPEQPLPAGIEERESVVFSGNFGYHPNETAVRYFHTRIWPALRQRFPGLRWRLVGCNAEALPAQVRRDDRIEVIGAVDDALPWLAAAKVAVVPLLSGSGTRLKILEAWAAGRAVVSTALGAQGLRATPGEHFLQADDTTAFTEAVGRLLLSDSLRRQLGSRGRALYEEQYTWTQAWSCLPGVGI